jgi:ribosome-associated protein
VVRIPDDELTIRFSRSSGPGGQNVNKRSTRVEVLFDPLASRALSALQKSRARQHLRRDARGLVRVTSSAGRTQLENRRRAVERLHELVTEAVRPPAAPRKRTRPAAAAVDRRIGEKKRRAKVKTMRARPRDED